MSFQFEAVFPKINAFKNTHPSAFYLIFFVSIGYLYVSLPTKPSPVGVTINTVLC